MSELENWAPTRVKSALDDGKIVLIDVRTPQEYMIEHVEGALLMPMAFFMFPVNLIIVLVPILMVIVAMLVQLSPR